MQNGKTIKGAARTTGKSVPGRDAGPQVVCEQGSGTEGVTRTIAGSVAALRLQPISGLDIVQRNIFGDLLDIDKVLGELWESCQYFLKSQPDIWAHNVSKLFFEDYNDVKQRIDANKLFNEMIDQIQNFVPEGYYINVDEAVINGALKYVFTLYADVELEHEYSVFAFEPVVELIKDHGSGVLMELFVSSMKTFTAKTGTGTWYNQMDIVLEWLQNDLTGENDDDICDEDMDLQIAIATERHHEKAQLLYDYKEGAPADWAKRLHKAEVKSPELILAQAVTIAQMADTNGAHAREVKGICELIKVMMKFLIEWDGFRFDFSYPSSLEDENGVAPYAFNIIWAFDNYFEQYEEYICEISNEISGNPNYTEFTLAAGECTVAPTKVNLNKALTQLVELQQVFAKMNEIIHPLIPKQ